jgi:hypothetical protein
VFLLVIAVPALLVVVAGYAVGHALTGAEPAGWVTGTLTLLVAVRAAVAARRRARRQDG